MKQVVSPLLSEVPGLGTHFSKQCSFTFWEGVSGWASGRGQRRGSREGWEMDLGKLVFGFSCFSFFFTSINCLALVMAAS